MALVSSDDDWASASVVATYEAEYNVTTSALRDGEVYLLYSHLELLFGGADPRETFEIVHVDFMMDE